MQAGRHASGGGGGEGRVPPAPYLQRAHGREDALHVRLHALHRAERLRHERLWAALGSARQAPAGHRDGRKGQQPDEALWLQP